MQAWWLGREYGSTAKLPYRIYIRVYNFNTCIHKGVIKLLKTVVMYEKREARTNKKDINFGNDVMYEKIQFHVKILANR